MPFDVGVIGHRQAAHLSRARKYLVDHGWCPKGPTGNDGTVCPSNALIATRDGTQQELVWEPTSSWSLFCRAAEEIGPDYFESIGQWNDMPGRTFEQVLAVFDRAIANAVGNATVQIKAGRSR